MNRFLILSLNLWFALLAAQAVGQNYTVVDLGLLPGGSLSVGQGINQSGQVTGYANTTTANGLRGFLYSNGTMTDLGALPGSTNIITVGAAINDTGQIAGYSDVAGNIHAFLYNNGTMADLGTLPGGFLSLALGINLSNQVTGYAGDSGAVPHAFLYSGGMMQDLGFLPGGNSSQGLGINQSGQVTGDANTSSGQTHVFLYSGGVMQDLGTLGGEFGIGTAINQSAQVTGASDLTNGGNLHAFLYSSGVMYDLGIMPGGTLSFSNAINQSGQMVGYGDTSGVQHALLFSNGTSVNRTVQDLNTLIPANSGWTLTQAYGINNTGQITGQGTINGATHAFLLNPVAPPYTALVQQPINPDGSSIFSASRGVVPVKFILTLNNAATCQLPAATIALTRTAGGTLGAIDESTYLASADSGSNFRISSCQYVYNLAANSLGVGAYRVDIKINGVVVGNGVFALK